MDHFDRVGSCMVGESMLSKWSMLVNMLELSIRSLPLENLP